MPDPGLDEPAFGSGEPFTLGAETELFLVDAGGRQLNSAPEVVEGLPDFDRGEVSPEVHACQTELISGVARSAAEAVEDLDQVGALGLAHGSPRARERHAPDGARG